MIILEQCWNKGVLSQYTQKCSADNTLLNWTILCEMGKFLYSGEIGILKTTMLYGNPPKKILHYLKKARLFILPFLLNYLFFTYKPQFPLPPLLIFLTHLLSTLLHSSWKVRPPMKVNKAEHIKLMQDQAAPTPASRLSEAPTIANRFQKASSCTRIDPGRIAGPHKQTKKARLLLVSKMSLSWALF